MNKEIIARKALERLKKYIDRKHHMLFNWTPTIIKSTSIM